MDKTPQASHKAAVQQSYRFEFGCDSAIYSVSFKCLGREPKLRGMLESARRTSFENSGRAIRSYLDSQDLYYSEFSACGKLTEDRIIMQFADKLLHAGSCSIIDEYTGSADVCCCVMDYRHETGDGCRGCYYAVAKIPSVQNGHFQYHVVSQTFHHDASGGNEQAHFAIRKSGSRHQLLTLDKEDSCPVLGTFGCVDMLGLLISIADITTKQQAAELANI